MKKLIIIALLFAGCATGRKMASIQVGMTKADVVHRLGRPKGVGVDAQGEYLVYNYANHSALPLSGGRTNYVVRLKDGKVVSYGPL